MSSNSSLEPRLSRGGQTPATEKEHNQCNATIWCMIMTWQYAGVWANASSNQIKWSWFEPKVQIQTPCKAFQMPFIYLSNTAAISCSNMHENAIFRFFGFFWSFFIYNLFHLELRLNFYDFLEVLCIFWNFLIYFKSRNPLLRQHDNNIASAGQLGWSRSSLTCGVHWSVTL